MSSCVDVLVITSRNEVVAKVMFLLVSMILSTGGCLPQCMLGYHPPGADTPQSRPPRQSRHPLQEQTPPGKQTPAYGQWAAGTHPTGMHSCLRIK